MGGMTAMIIVSAYSMLVWYPIFLKTKETGSPPKEGASGFSAPKYSMNVFPQLNECLRGKISSSDYFYVSNAILCIIMA